jgi:hypothetical protein
MSIQPPEQLSEAEYLDQEIHLARRAMAQAQAQLKGDVRRLADPRIWVRSYPVASTLVACVAGVLLARGARRKVREREEVGGEVLEADKKASTRTSSFLQDLAASLRKSLVRVLTSGLVSQAMSVLQSYVSPDAAYAHEQNGPEAVDADVGGQI